MKRLMKKNQKQYSYKNKKKQQVIERKQIHITGTKVI